MHRPVTRALPSIAAVAIVPALLYAGFRNHRSSERGAMRIVRQLLAIAAFAIVAVFLAIAVAGVVGLQRG